jgi:hypothetical protein
MFFSFFRFFSTVNFHSFTRWLCIFFVFVSFDFVYICIMYARARKDTVLKVLWCQPCVYGDWIAYKMKPFSGAARIAYWHKISFYSFINIKYVKLSSIKHKFFSVTSLTAQTYNLPYWGRSWAQLARNMGVSVTSLPLSVCRRPFFFSHFKLTMTSVRVLFLSAFI